MNSRKPMPHKLPIRTGYVNFGHTSLPIYRNLRYFTMDLRLRIEILHTPIMQLIKMPHLWNSLFAKPLAFMHYFIMISIEEIVGDEWVEWYQLTPAQRWIETEKLWRIYLQLGGSLDPEPDTQSPFFYPETPRSHSAHGRTGLHIVRRSRV
jgi:hypothetical protein